jgi:hypothetical protein
MDQNVRPRRVLVTRSRRAKAGFALAAVLLVALGLLLLAHGAVALAERELTTSRLEARLIGRHFAARSALVTPVADTLPGSPPVAVVVGSGMNGPFRWRLEARRLAPEMLLLTGAAIRTGVPGEAQTSVVAWSIRSIDRVAAARGVIEAGGEIDIASGAVLTDGYLEPPEAGWSARCRAVLSALDSARVSTPPAVSRLVAAPADLPVPALGPLPGETARLRALSGGGAAHLRGASGDLELARDTLEGVLVVEGDLRLSRGATVAGLALVGGDLLVRSGASLVGLARVGGALRVDPGGVVRGSACAAALALEAARELRRPLPMTTAFPATFP